jgi:hypothetical protein
MFEAPIVAQAVKNDPDALAFLRAIASVLHTWDDLIDGDRELSDADINGAFWKALIDIPANPFYRKHELTLRAVLVQAIVNWSAATALERDEKATRDDLIIAFIIRSAYVDLLTMSATLIGGVEWACSLAPAIRRWAHGEKWEGYLNNLRDETAARQGASDVLR